MKNQDFKIKGMTCAACSGRIERVLSKADGIHSCSVNLTTEVATVSFDENTISSEDIINKVIKLGFGAEEYVEEKNVDNNEHRSLVIRLLISACLTSPLFAGMVLMCFIFYITFSLSIRM